MTNFSASTQPEAAPMAPQLPPQSIPVQKQKNVLGIVALVAAILGFIFACIPGALIIGWILLPISFILAIISLFMKGKKGFGVTALIVSVVGTIVGVMVFISGVASAVDESFSGGEVSADQPISNEESSANTDEGAANEGSRSAPYPIGTAITQGDWTVTVNSATLDGTQDVLGENPYNDAPAEGNQYLIANVTATYNGENPEGEMAMLSLEYVTADGNTVNSYDASVIAPDSFDSMSTLYTGASTTGNYIFEVPVSTAGEGTFALQANLFGDKTFIAVQ